MISRTRSISQPYTASATRNSSTRADDTAASRTRGDSGVGIVTVEAKILQRIVSGWKRARAPTYLLERRAKVGGQRRTEIERRTRRRMTKDEPRGVQKVSWNRRDAAASSRHAAVRFVPHHRMSDRCQVDPDLMRPTGVQVRAQQIGAVERAAAHEVGTRRSAGTDDRHALAVSWVTRDRTLDREPVAREVAEREHGI